MTDSIPPLVEGNSTSPVRVVIYEDLQCPDCAWLRRKMDEVLLPAYKDHVAFEHREFPLPRHSWARQAAIAARSFPRDHGVAFRREVLADLGSISNASLPLLVKSFVRRHHLVQVAMDDPQLAAAVESDYQSGLARRVEKTPTIFLGERSFVERIPLQELTAAIDQAMEPVR